MKTPKGYIILGFKNEKIFGYVENSFSMGFSEDHVYVYDAFYTNAEYTKTACNTKGWKVNSTNQFIWFIVRETVNRLNKEYKGDAIFKGYRINSKRCPVNVDLLTRLKVKKEIIPWNKYNHRNAAFKIK